MSWTWRGFLKRIGFGRSKRQEMHPTMGPVSFNLGIDFGTRFTKVCYRDVASEKSGIITFGVEAGNWQKAMVPSVVRVHQDGQLKMAWSRDANRTAPEKFNNFDYLKLRLASLDPTFRDPAWNLGAIPELDELCTEAVCTFFLARVIIEAKRLVAERESERTEGREVQWSANVGVPVEYCDSASIARFRKVLSAAWMLSIHQQFPEP